MNNYFITIILSQFVYSTDEDSFQKVKNWVKELKKMLGSEIVLTIVGNKIDLNKDRVVPYETAERYAIRMNVENLKQKKLIKCFFAVIRKALAPCILKLQLKIMSVWRIYF